MTDKALEKRLLTYFQALARHEKMSALDYIKSLTTKDEPSNKKLLGLAGTISKEDLELMEEAIKESCEKVDKDEW